MAYQIIFEHDQLKALIDRNQLDKRLNRLDNALRKGAVAIQQQAVRNVSGYPFFTQHGEVTVVRVRTGALKGSISLQKYGVLTWRVYVNGTHTATPMAIAGQTTMRATPVSAYAGAIEWGHGEIDLKKTMRGKIVPFFASRMPNTVGPFTARGLTPLDPNSRLAGSLWENEELNAKLAAKGKGPMHFRKHGKGRNKATGAYYISFRRVGNKGWIIPRAEPRPFMRAAAEKVLEDVYGFVADAMRF